MTEGQSVLGIEADGITPCSLWHKLIVEVNERSGLSTECLGGSGHKGRVEKGEKLSKDMVLCLHLW